MLPCFESGSTATSVPFAEYSAGILNDTESVGHMVRSAGGQSVSCAPAWVAAETLACVLELHADENPGADGQALRSAAAAA